MKTIKSLIKAAIKKNELDLNSHYQALEILKSVEGKQFNLRTFNKKVLKGSFEFTSEHGMFHLVNIEHGQNHLIGYHQSNGIDSSKFYELDTCYSKGSEERLNRLANLDIKKLEKAQRLLSKHFNAIRDIFGEMETNKLGSYENPIYHDILKNVYDEKESRNSRHIKLVDFYYIRTNNKTVEL